VFRSASPEAASALIKDAIQAPSAAPAHGRRPIPRPLNVRDIRIIESRQQLRARIAPAVRDPALEQQEES